MHHIYYPIPLSHPSHPVRHPHPPQHQRSSFPKPNLHFVLEFDAVASCGDSDSAHSSRRPSLTSSSSDAEYMTTPSGLPTPLWNFLYNPSQRPSPPRVNDASAEAQPFRIPWDKLLTLNRDRVESVSVFLGKMKKTVRTARCLSSYDAFMEAADYADDDSLDVLERERMKVVGTWSGVGDERYRSDVPLPVLSPPLSTKLRVEQRVPKRVVLPFRPHVYGGGCSENGNGNGNGTASGSGRLAVQHSQLQIAQWGPKRIVLPFRPRVAGVVNNNGSVSGLRPLPLQAPHRVPKHVVLPFQPRVTVRSNPCDGSTSISGPLAIQNNRYGHGHGQVPMPPVNVLYPHSRLQPMFNKNLAPRFTSASAPRIRLQW